MHLRSGQQSNNLRIGIEYPVSSHHTHPQLAPAQAQATGELLKVAMKRPCEIKVNIENPPLSTSSSCSSGIDKFQQ